MEGATTLDIVPTACLSNCKRGCSVALSHSYKYSYVLANLSKEHIEDLVTLIHTYDHNEEGILKKADRPESLKDKVMGRIPPLKK